VLIIVVAAASAVSSSRNSVSEFLPVTSTFGDRLGALLRRRYEPSKGSAVRVIFVVTRNDLLKKRGLVWGSKDVSGNWNGNYNQITPRG
jgi:hypothetical protein